MLKNIVQAEASILRTVARVVPASKLGSKEIKLVLKAMSMALAAEGDGVALAAPQISLPLRIFIVSGKVQRILRGDDKEYQDEVYINPKFIKLSSKKQLLDEGCLSVRWKYGQVKRSAKATVEAYDEKGKKFRRDGSGLLAQIFQHEIDHLDGVLFTDKAINIEDVPPLE